MPIAENQRLEVRLRGRVQGVGFRHFTRVEAGRRPVEGFVRNEPDGSVTVVAEGPADALHEFLAVIREGPPSAIVNEVETRWSLPTGEFDGFGVGYK
jgi:acylphosphatase